MTKIYLAMYVVYCKIYKYADNHVGDFYRCTLENFLAIGQGAIS